MRTIGEAALALRNKHVTSEDLTRECLAQISRLSGLNAFITVVGDRAIDEARKLDAELRQGHDRGPLHGIPIALKDVFDPGSLELCGFPHTSCL